MSGSTGEVYSKGVDFRVGNGSRVQFWVDDWMVVGLLSVLFPRIFRLVLNKESVVKEGVF